MSQQDKSISRRAPRGGSTLAVLLLLCVCMIRGFWSDLRQPPSKPEIPLAKAMHAPSAVDPNSAPWWELTVLPRIGISLARQIVDYRQDYQASRAPHDDARPFKKPADLQNVRGIGPATVLRIADELTFASAQTQP